VDSPLNPEKLINICSKVNLVYSSRIDGNRSVRDDGAGDTDSDGGTNYYQLAE